MSVFTNLFTTALLVATATLYAKPKIEFDTREFDCGTILKGSVTKIDAVFNVKNIGDEPLKLTKVKPSCGCTVVKYDSLIQPGTSTAIKSTVNIKGRTGSLRKAVTVTSNAKSDSIVRLIIKATIIDKISSSLKVIDMTGEHLSNAVSFQLISPEENLKINKVTFAPDVTSKKDKASAQSSNVTYTFTPVDTTRADQLLTYQLELQPVTLKAAASGNFILSTSHPDLKEMKIRGKVGKTK